MPVPTLPANLTPADYETIEAAVMETVKGRWFLMEFARRNRSHELAQIRETLARMERMTSAGLRQPETSAPGIAIAPDPFLEEEMMEDWEADYECDRRAEAEAANPLSALDALPIHDKLALFA